MEVASRRPIRVVKKARKGWGQDVRNRRSGHGGPVCRPHWPDEQVEEQQLELLLLSALLS